jgi:dihydrolipoamide dehydrogenase
LVIAFKRSIIAAGSQAVRLPFMPNYPRVVDSTGALALKEVPKRMLIIGSDVVGQPMLAHKAVHEAHVAAEVIAGELLGNKELAAAAFNARVIPSVAYTDPEVAWVGLTEDQAKAQGIKVKKGLFPWAASGRAIANGRDEGVTKLLFDDSPEAHGHGKILGGGMVGTHAGDMIGEIALAIEMGADAVDIGKTIHPHPTLGESIGMAAEVAHGSCTDVPPARK